MRALHLLAPAAFGGLESVVRALGCGLREVGVDLRIGAVIEHDGGPHSFVDAARRDGIPLDEIRVPSRAYLRETRAVRDILARWNPEIVHSHGYRSDLVGAAAARRLGIPTVTTLHGFTNGGLKNRLYEWLQRRSLSRFDSVIAVSHSIAERVEGVAVPSGRVRTIPNAWRPPAESLTREAARRELGIAIDDSAFHIGFVGRVGLEKGPDILLAATTRVDTDVMVHVLGEGSARAELEEFAEREHISNRVVWHGRVPEASRVMRAFDLLALPSRTEGTPMVLFEATAAGVPVLATAVGGVPDVLGRGPNVVPPENSGLLAAALRLLQKSPTERAAALERARRRIEHDYSHDRWIEEHLNLYHELARAGREGGGR